MIGETDEIMAVSINPHFFRTQCNDFTFLFTPTIHLNTYNWFRFYCLHLRGLNRYFVERVRNKFIPTMTNNGNSLLINFIIFIKLPTYTHVARWQHATSLLFFWLLIIHTEKSVANNKNQFWFVGSGGGAREN